MGFLDNLFDNIKAAAKAVSDMPESKPASVSESRNAHTSVSTADSVPDTPVRFGYKASWLCVKADSPEAVIEKLGLKNAVKSSWKYGFANLNFGTFVSPVLDGRVLVIGWGYDIVTEDSARLDEVGAMFPDVQFFSSHRVSDYYTWVRYIDGVKVRAYGYCGGDGEVFANEGEPTPEEQALGFVNFMPDSEADWDEYDFPDEETVVKIAAAWGINTLKLDKYPASTGFYCKP